VLRRRYSDQSKPNLSKASTPEELSPEHTHAAIKHCRERAENGDVVAQTDLGRCYLGGIGVERDEAAAAEWFSRAAESGYRPAAYMLGGCYYSGVGVAQDIKEAIEWCSFLPAILTRSSHLSLSHQVSNCSIRHHRSRSRRAGRSRHLRDERRRWSPRLPGRPHLLQTGSGSWFA
jgi:hypothetical protein